MQSYREQLEKGEIQQAYRGLIKYLIGVKTLFTRKYPDVFCVGSFYQGYMDITYFTLTPLSMKKTKLKVGIGFNHEDMEFGIWLGAQNRKIQKVYWELFKSCDWNRYTVSPEVNKSFTIIEDTLIKDPDFDNLIYLTEMIEKKTIKFISDIEKFLN